MQHEFLTLDQGPEFVGWSGMVGQTVVCVMTPTVHTDPATRRIARQLVHLQGGDCASCNRDQCPLKALAA